jgi:hypothetical protein
MGLPLHRSPSWDIAGSAGPTQRTDRRQDKSDRVRAGVSGQKRNKFNAKEKGAGSCDSVRLRLSPWRDAAFCTLPTVTL